MAEFKTFRLRAPTGGIDNRSSPDAYPLDKARVLQNAVSVIPGYVSMRGPLLRLGAITAKAGRTIGGPSWGDKVLVGHVDDTSLDVNEFGIRPDDAELTPANRHITTAGVATDITAATDKSVTPQNDRGARLDALTYYLSATTLAAATQTVYGTTVINKRRVVSWDGALATTILTNGPTYCIDMTTYAERVFVLGGVPPGGGTFSDSNLYFSDAGGPTADTAAMWQDDVSAVVNKIRVGQSDHADYGVALCPINNGLAILKRRSIWVLRGSGPQTFQVRRFAGDVGCMSTESAIPWRDGVLFMSENGVMYFDGSQLTPMSENVIHRGSALAGGRAVATPLGNEHFLFRYVTSGASGIYYVLNAPDRVWTEFTFDGSLFAKAPLFLHADKPIVVDNACVWDATELPIPVSEQISFVSLSGSEKDYSGTNRGYNVVIQYRYMRLGSQGLLAQLHRVVFNTRIIMDSLTDAGGAGAAIYDASAAGTGAGLIASYAIPTSSFSQHIKDLHAECEDLVIQFGFGSTSPGTETFLYGDVGDAHIIYQPTRQRR